MKKCRAVTDQWSEPGKKVLAPCIKFKTTLKELTQTLINLKR